jgi:hypothetical protein
MAARTFVTPGNLFELAFEQAILRSVSGQFFQTQREFRDQLRQELRNVGFSLNDAAYLANSAAAFGLNGNLVSVYGVSAARLEAIDAAAINRISGDFGISAALASDIYNRARTRAILSAPFSSEDQFRVVLQEEIQRETINSLGRYDGHSILDRAIADLASPSSVLSLAALTEQLGAHVLAVLRPDLGMRVAEELKNQILTALLGGNTIEKIENEETRNPLSTLHLVDTQISHLLRIEEDEEMRKMLRRLIQLLQALLKPNADIGYLLQSLTDHPSTFIGSLLVDKPKGEFLDIPI